MSTLEILLPEKIKAVVDQQVSSGRFSTESEYVCRLIEEDERRRAHAEVESLLVTRLTGSDKVEMNVADWDQMREEFRRRVAAGDRR